MCDQYKYLNVAEKNSAAKNIAAYLSGDTARVREGLSKYNKIYEFGAEILGQKCHMVMTSVSGHLLELEFVSPSKNWHSCNPFSLFGTPVHKDYFKNCKGIKKTLEREIHDCQGLIIWTDCDREGENIGFEIIDVCTAVKRNLKIYRAKFSEITAVSVRRALQNLGQPNKNISDAVDVRQELDLRIGAAFTRYQTLQLQKGLHIKGVVSYGSCQFPTLGFVIERYKAVESFVAESFWEIKVTHVMHNMSIDFSWQRVRLFDHESCQLIHDICTQNPKATVTKVETKLVTKSRPLPLNTVEFEKLASRQLNIKAQVAMNSAERLYTQGFISYPRTETNKYPDDMNLHKLVMIHRNNTKVGDFVQRILDNGGPNPRQGDKTDQAHPPIHPIKYARKLKGNDRRLYKLILRSFLACCSSDAEGQDTLVVAEVALETFNACGLVVAANNYLDVYPYEEWPSKSLPAYKIGETFDPTSIELVFGTTSPPNLLDEADLIDLMVEHNIGTDATHVTHIEKIKKRAYVIVNDDSHFIPGPLGMGLVEGYESMGLNVTKPQLRAQLEADLKDIAEGRKNPLQVKTEQIAKHRDIYKALTIQADRLETAISKRLILPQSGNTLSAEMMPSTASGTTLNTTQNDFEYDSDSSGSSGNNCYCGDPCTTNTVFKGANKGRLFYGCPNYRNIRERCFYFHWAETDSDIELNNVMDHFENTAAD